MEKYAQFTKEINGKKYTAQFNGLSFALEAPDKCYIDDDSKNISSKKFTELILTHVIVDPPKLTPDDFSSMKELQAVVKFGNEVMQGEFREEEVPSTVKK